MPSTCCGAAAPRSTRSKQASSRWSAVVSGLRAGLALDDACRAALADTLALEDPYAGHFSLIAVDRAGTPAAWSNRKSTYVVMTPHMAAPEERERRVLDP